jgi:hypothetical protein
LGRKKKHNHYDLAACIQPRAYSVRDCRVAANEWKEKEVNQEFPTGFRWVFPDIIVGKTHQTRPALSMLAPT